MTSNTTYCLLLALLTYLFVVYMRPKHPPLPPGPRKLPIIGNIFNMPRGFEWLTFTEWGKRYNSDVIHVQAAGMNMVVLNSVEAASDLLEKRWRVYSDRPRFPMAAELMGWEWQFSSMSYGEEFRTRRKILQDHFPPFKHDVHRPISERFVHILLQQLYKTPENFLDHTRHTIGGIVLSLAYGIDIKPINDPFVALAEEAIRTLAIAAVPGTFLVDIVPALKYVPEWIPGAGFKRIAKEWKKLALASKDMPFEEGERKMLEGTANRSFMSLAIDTIDTSKDVTYQRNVIRDAAGMFFSAGSDTSVSALHSFILYMLCYPDVQRTAQLEIDSVIVDGRLPTFKEEGSLPYVSAIIKEVLRVRPPAPMAIPHSLGKDDVYKDYHIPARSFVIANVWGMLHNEKDYPDPYNFIPERFLKDGKLNPDVRDPASVVFGFGRRVCPGSHIAWSALWLSAASILAILDILPAVDEQGNNIVPSMEYGTSLVYRPLPFQCKILPRSESAENVLTSMFTEPDT